MLLHREELTTTKTMPFRPNPLGRSGMGAISSLRAVVDVKTSTSVSRLGLPGKTHRCWFRFGWYRSLSDIIDPMNRDSYLLLISGLLVGFIATYLVVRDRDLGPIVIRDALVTSPAPSAENMQDDSQMIQRLEAELIETPDDSQLLVDLANLYFDIQSYQGAIAYYDRALELRPDDPSLRTDLATALYYSNQVDRAMVEFETSLAIAPNHPQTLFNMGVVLLENRNDREGAIELWEKLILMNPTYPQLDLVRTEIERVRNQP